MSRRKKAAIGVAAFSILCGLIIWHAVRWYSIGMYLEMFSWVGTDKAYLTVLYNLGLMVVLGIVLSFFMNKITDLIGQDGGGIKHFNEMKTDGNSRG